MELKKLVTYSFTTLLISDALEYLASTAVMSFNPVYVAAFLKAISLYCLFSYNRKVKWKNEIPKPVLNIFRCLLFWNVITIIRGALSAQDYWDWRYLGLSSFFYFLIPYAMVVGILFFNNLHLFKFILKKVYVYSFLLLPLSFFGLLLYSRVIISVCMYILLSVYLKRSWRLAILFAAFCSVITGFEIRANVLRIAIAVILMGLYFIRRVVKLGILRIVCVIFLIAPFVFLSLGISDQFNIFQPFDDNDETYVIGEGDGTSSNLVADTRTLLYQEVFSSMLNNNISLFFGGGATAKYQSRIIVEANEDRGRYRSEVGFLNTLLYSGIIGVLLYFLILVSAAFYALNRSNNFFVKLLGIFVATRWVLFFIEDITLYDMNFYFLWIAIGMCFSTRFRNVTDHDIKNIVVKYIQA
ncbi:MAG: hypothetical protein QM802_13130 [Agriterribacter sp.]